MDSSKTPSEIARAKNMDLLIHGYNNEAKLLNKQGFLDKESEEAKDLRKKYESITARFDTDKNTKKKAHIYKYAIPLDSKEIIGLKGIKPPMKIRS